MAILVQSNKKPSISYPEQTGSIVTFNSQYAGLPLKSHKIALTATQSGSGTPSPSNPRPITGYSAINISHSDADTSNPTVYTIQIGSTVYGGEYDARTGVLTVTHGIVDLGSVSWDKYTNAAKTYFRTSSEVADMKKSNNQNVLQGLVCSIYPEATWSPAIDSANYNEFICKGWIGRSYIAIADTNYDNYTPSDFKTAMSGAQLVYELATPQTIQLPPCPIDTLLGVNNIWADTGDTTVSFIKIGG